MLIDKRIKAFVELGEFLEQFADIDTKKVENALNDRFYSLFNELIETVHIYNGWFTPENVRNAITGIVHLLKKDSLIDWLSAYINELSHQKETKKVAVIMAGNIPMVGFHDMLCVLISGNKFIGKLSSDDKLLLPTLTKILIAIEPEFEAYIQFNEGTLKDIDAVIATGSNNSSRYFEYYFGKYPHIIRKNRNSVAILTGKESTEELTALGGDIFQYFGLGCRNVSKLFVPKGYKFDTFYESIFQYNAIVNNNKYGNNYEYNRTVYLMNSSSNLLDNNFLLLKEDTGYTSPIGVLYYEYYNNVEELEKKLLNEADNIQCIVGNYSSALNKTPFGTAQSPKPNDYADGIDTMRFLIKL